ncbi:MAG TPA: membrane-bound PQQ-dependent dehydrogenase, glucose/quinate/shikimate family [Rickettsiales bacterium]|nr:membrane-bound PQQ-dependent dehydrogenase, glucose/quinate/shikimate family [Rickettsiales bacterium]
MDTQNKFLFSRRNIISVPGITGLVVALIGLTLLVLGAKLVMLGGSWYYAITGALLILSGLLVTARKKEGLWLYALILLGTVIWAIWEVGLDGWKLLPRVFAPAIIGIWLYLPWVAGRMQGIQGNAQRRKCYIWAGTTACFVLAASVIILGYRVSAPEYQRPGTMGQQTATAQPVPPVADDEWLYYGRTADGDRFSPLAQITPENVSKLKVAWQFRTGDLPTQKDIEKGKEFSFEATPIKVHDNLYFCTPHRHIISLNATTGKKNWEFDPHSETSHSIFVTCRGVAYSENMASAECPRRIISGTGSASLVALNADTGELCQGFGNKGYVSLTEHMGEVPPGFHFISSQPMVVDNRVIVGGWIYDNEAEGEPSGVVRAYDSTTGALVWSWDLGRADPTAPLKPGEHFTRGTPNAWGTLTADAALGLVYLPMGNATPDYFGGKRRPFDDKYSSAVVALNIATGKERWHFQTVHHDLWDFDLPIGPSLVDLNTPAGTIPALVQTTKRGEFFLLDRRNGKPLTQIEERPVPQKPASGEYLSPTQPYPVGFPSLAPADVTEKGTWGATPIDQLLCRIDFRERRYDGQFTPPTVGKYLAYPAFFGVTDWFGASIDPARKLLISNSSYLPMVMHYMTQEEALKEGKVLPWQGWGHPVPKLLNVSYNPQYGTPYAIEIEPWLNYLGVPCIAPPWGKLTAIDLDKRKVVWQRLLGTTYGSGLFRTHFGPALPTGIFNMGGNIITASGLVFISATADDDFRAFDEGTGKMLWRDHLPAGGNATPMTYKGSDGRQYIVIAAGGHGGLQTLSGDYVIAYALPDTNKAQ